MPEHSEAVPEEIPVSGKAKPTWLEVLNPLVFPALLLAFLLDLVSRFVLRGPWPFKIATSLLVIALVIVLVDLVAWVRRPAGEREPIGRALLDLVMVVAVVASLLLRRQYWEPDQGTPIRALGMSGVALVAAAPRGWTQLRRRRQSMSEAAA